MLRVTAYATELNFCNVFLFLKLFRSVKLIQACKNLYGRIKPRKDNCAQGCSSVLRAVVHLVFLVEVPRAGGPDSHGDRPVLSVVGSRPSYRFSLVETRKSNLSDPARSVYRAVP